MPVPLHAAVLLKASPNNLDLTALKRRIVGAAQNYVSSNPFAYVQLGLKGQIYKEVPEIQSMTLLDPVTADASIIETSMGATNFKSAMSRYYLNTNDVTLSFTGTS